MRAGANALEPGWLCEPSVTYTTVQGVGRPASHASVPPQPMTSSSGCGETIRIGAPSTMEGVLHRDDMHEQQHDEHDEEDSADAQAAATVRIIRPAIVIPAAAEEQDEDDYDYEQRHRHLPGVPEAAAPSIVLPATRISNPAVHLLEDGHRRFGSIQLLGGALPRRLIGAPAQGPRAVAHTSAAHLIELHLEDEFGTQLHVRAVALFTAIPTAGRRIGR